MAPELAVPGIGVELDYRAVFAAVPGLYLVLDPEFTIVSVSEAYCRATMTSAAQLVGHNLFDMFPDNPDDPYADGVLNLRTSLERVVDLKRADSMAVQKYDIRGPDGSFEERYWSPLNTPVVDQEGDVRWIIHRVEDVTELVRLKSDSQVHDQQAREMRRMIEDLRQANRELAETSGENKLLRFDRLFLADIVESSNDAIIGRKVDGEVTSWNQGAERMFGYRPGDIIGHSIMAIVPERLRATADQVMARISDGEPVMHYESFRQHKDGQELLVSVTVSPVMDQSGEVVGSSAIMRDITEQRRAEERLKALQSELVHLARWNTMGMMTATLAHELNQPLTAAMNYVRAARRTLNGANADIEKVKGFLDQAVEETKLAGGIIRSLREFIERRETSREREDVNKIVQEAIALSLVGGPDRKLDPTLFLTPGLGPVMVDKIQIEQVLLNLVRNALDAMEETEAPRLFLRTAPDEPGFVRISVSDNGPGIDPDVKARLFQPFVTTKEKGMGIGLTICQSIIEAHGGQIWTEPHQPKGTSFHIRLPEMPAV